MRLFVYLAGLVLAGLVMMAADLSGTWTAEVPRRDGGTDATRFVFRVDGAKVEGTVTTPSATYAIKEGTIDEGSLRFYITVNMGRDVKFFFTGKPRGEQIDFVREIQWMGFRTSFVAKRAR